MLRVVSEPITQIERSPINALFKDIQRWIATMKAQDIAPDYLSEVSVMIGGMKWVDPQEKIYQVPEEDKIVEQRETISREVFQSRTFFHMGKENNIEQYDFQQESEDVFKFINGVKKPFAIFCTVIANTKHVVYFSAFESTIVQLGGKSCQEITELWNLTISPELVDRVIPLPQDDPIIQLSYKGERWINGLQRYIGSSDPLEIVSLSIRGIKWVDAEQIEGKTVNRKGIRYFQSLSLSEEKEFKTAARKISQPLHQLIEVVATFVQDVERPLGVYFTMSGVTKNGVRLPRFTHSIVQLNGETFETIKKWLKNVT